MAATMIIDCHCHAGKGDIMTAPWNTDAPIEPYLRRARAAGIAKTIVFPPFHSDYSQANAELARIVARYPSRLIGFAFVHATRDAGRIFGMIERAVKQWGFAASRCMGTKRWRRVKCVRRRARFACRYCSMSLVRPTSSTCWRRNFPT
jgi:uncharacterized protein